MPIVAGHSKKGKSPEKTRGFTLVELSVVLVIIGFIVGAILVGKALIRETQINSAMMDAQRYITATKNFQQKYNALPGDMGNATSYWGAMGTCPATAGSASPGGTLTCNGDGNGQISPSYILTNANYQEGVLFWQHLVNAQLIQGNYTGIVGSAGSWDNVIGVNVPAGRLPGLGFGIYFIGVCYGNPSGIWFDGNYGHVMTLGAYDASYQPFNPILTTLEAQSFDNKYDDGLPAYGNVRAWKNANGFASQYCTTTNVSATALYNTAASGTNSAGLQCNLVLITGF